MPAFNAISPPALYPGDSYVVINAEQPTTGTQSQQVALAKKDTDAIVNVSVEISFAAAPGAFEIDVETADSNVAGAFVSNPAYAVTAVNSTFYARVELTGVVANFMCLATKTANANGVNCTAVITRG